MSPRRTVSILAASTCLAALPAGPALARQADQPLRPARAVAATHLTDVQACGAAERAAAIDAATVGRDAGGARRPDVPVAPASASAATTPLVAADDGGLGAVSWALLVAGACAALLGAAYLGARMAG